MSRTPAQISGRYDFVTDVPIQGPTDEGIRAADCWWVQNVLPRPPGNGSTGGRGPGPACTDCNGPIPRWVNRPRSWGGGPTEYGGNGGPECSGERIRYGSRHVAGFSLDAAGDAAVAITNDQASWVCATLTNLNTQIGQATGTSCANWRDPGLGWSTAAGMATPPEVTAAVGCFQGWYNANSGGSLRTDGVLDQDTLSALQAIAVAHPADFTTPYPGGAPADAAPPASPPSGTVPSAAQSASGTVPEPPSASPAEMAHHDKKKEDQKKGKKCDGLEGEEKKKCEESEKGLSTGAKVAIAAGATVVAGGILYALATKGSSKPSQPATAERRRR